MISTAQLLQWITIVVPVLLGLLGFAWYLGGRLSRMEARMVTWGALSAHCTKMRNDECLAHRDYHEVSAVHHVVDTTGGA